MSDWFGTMIDQGAGSDRMRKTIKPIIKSLPNRLGVTHGPTARRLSTKKRGSLL
jgi:hypothetical protein